MDVVDWNIPNRIARDLLRKLEAHNPSRKGHGDRVSVYAVACAYEMGVRNEDLRILKFSAMLHDIGKLNIPTEILERKSTITEEERLRIRECVLSGGEFLLNTYEKWSSCSEILRHQYDPYDANSTIPLSSRILHVCSVYDMLVTPQPWREKKSEEEAIHEIQNLSGSQFDPDVIKSFLKIQPLIQPIRID